MSSDKRKFVLREDVEVAKEALIEIAEKACKNMDGFAQIGSSNYVIIDITKYVTKRK